MKEDFDILLKALLQEREEFLKNNPELREFQEQIDRELEKIGDDPLSRAQKMNQMLIKKMSEELLPAMGALKKVKKKANKLEQSINYYKQIKNKDEDKNREPA
ncbi:hypothetical protein N9N67_02550 [Bacteriovoracaceae bacterium]|nr:hypothetical protein [Bacteriovoracaceae bacterium]